jgi:asparagine N-glycosylation enzyme membrane subunit Stt3
MSVHNKFYKYFSAHPKLIFATDGLGALLSTLSLFGVASCAGAFGMPENVDYRIIPVTIIFTTYSLALYLINPKKWKLFLTLIAVANILYCCMTMVLLCYYFDKLTAIGLAYFFVEILVIVFLSRIEIRLAYNKSTEKQ